MSHQELGLFTYQCCTNPFGAKTKIQPTKSAHFTIPTAQILQLWITRLHESAALWSFYDCSILCLLVASSWQILSCTVLNMQYDFCIPFLFSTYLCMTIWVALSPYRVYHIKWTHTRSTRWYSTFVW